MKRFSLEYHANRGLRLDCDLGHGVALSDLPIRVVLSGHDVFYVWGGVDSGEGPPVWADPGLKLLCFGAENESPGFAHRVERFESAAGQIHFLATAESERATVTLRVGFGDGIPRFGLSIQNPQGLGGRSLPVCTVELRFENAGVGPGGGFVGAHPYGGRTHPYGEIASLRAPGVSFVHGCIGQGLPLVYLHDPVTQRGIEFEFLLDQRPIAWLRPGSTPGSAHWCVRWSPDRLLAPQQTHEFGGDLAVAGYEGRPVARMRRWRDEASSRLGLVPPPAPAWARRANIIEWNMNPKSGNGFTRLDDPRAHAMLERWRAMGYNAIFAVSQFGCGQNWLSPFSYEPCDEVGGIEAERTALRWAHELGFHIFLWVTTVGVDRDAPEVRQHPEWFTQRPDGKLFYAWDSHPENGYLGYAPDADSLATGWRRWLKDQVSRVIARGYDGIFVDGCIPRASNHARWSWPGESRNGVEDQLCELAGHVRGLGRGLVTLAEDESLRTQANCEMTVGRYTAMAPFFKKAYWDHGMGGGPQAQVEPPRRIPPEMAREYLLIRYASLLPGVLSKDVLEGYYSEACRPWTVQSLFAGCVPKTHSEFVDDPGTFRRLGDAEDPSAAERAAAHRLRGHEEFFNLLRLCRDEPLIREAPLSIEGVTVEGDDAVVGILRPTGRRALLALIQFANRPARVRVRLAPPDDVPAPQQTAAAQPLAREWHVREIMRSMVEETATPPGKLSSSIPLPATLNPYGFRIFELQR